MPSISEIQNSDAYLFLDFVLEKPGLSRGALGFPLVAPRKNFSACRHSGGKAEVHRSHTAVPRRGHSQPDMIGICLGCGRTLTDHCTLHVQ